MKKLYILALVALALFSGCKKDDILSNTFNATIENNGAKTTLNGQKVFWVEGDKISINNQDFTCTEVKTNATQATFSGPEGLTSPYKAYYPSNRVPYSRTYNPADGNFSEIPMYAESNDHNLVFKNCFAVLELTLTANKTVKTIFVSSDNGLGGSFLVNNDIASLEGSYLKTLTMDCGEGVDISSGKKFYFPILPGDHQLSIYLLATDGSVATITSSSHSYTRNKIYPVAKTLSTWKTPSYGPFTIDNEGHKVRFAPGNLRYSSEGYVDFGILSFYPNQYDFISVPENNWVDANAKGYFAWDTSAYNNSATGGLFLGQYNVNNGNYNSTIPWPGIGNWFVLSVDEWNYVLGFNDGDQRSGSTINGTTHCRFAKVQVNDIKGLLLVPDEATIPNIQFLNNISWNNSSSRFQNNTFTLDEWRLLESAGCVFLPAAGQYVNGRYQDHGNGLYWTRSKLVNPYNEHEYTEGMLYFSDNSTIYISIWYISPVQCCTIRLAQPWSN